MYVTILLRKSSFLDFIYDLLSKAEGLNAEWSKELEKQVHDYFAALILYLLMFDLSLYGFVNWQIGKLKVV